MLDPNVACFQCAVDTQLDHKRLRLELSPPRNFLRTFREDVIQPLLEPATLNSLPVLVVCIRKKDRVLARDDRRPLRQRHKLALHDTFDLACDLHDERFGLRTRFHLSIARRFFKHELRRLTIYPTSNFV
jgi:hypothetical protein